jgi:surface protein
MKLYYLKKIYLLILLCFCGAHFIQAQPSGNRGLYFDGAGFVTLTNNSLQDFNSNFAIEAWVKLTELASGEILPIFSKEDASLNGYRFGIFGFSATESQLRVWFNGTFIVSDPFPISNLVDKIWHHVAVSRSAGTYTFYLDGTILGGGGFAASNPIVNPAPSTIGSTPDGNFFFGQIDEVRIYGAARSQAQINTDKNSTTVDGATAFWRFEEATNQTANDLGANNIDGTLGSSVGADSSDPLWALRVKNANDLGAESLRQAIIDANTDTDTDYIDFSIDNVTPTVRTITLSSALPDIDNPIIIDGLSALGSDTQLRIDINGNGQTAGLSFAPGSDGSGVGGLIVRNALDGVVVDGATGIIISQNHIFDNTNNGISLINGGNNNKTVPLINSATTTLISGLSESNDVIEIFDDTPQSGTTDQGRTYLGTTTADGSGIWSFAGTFMLGHRITATATDGSGNTSAFSTAATVGGASNPFITTWITTDGQITIPTTGTGYNYNTTWTNLTNAGVGDGSATGSTGNLTISGLQNGSTYRVEISGDFPRIYFNNAGDKAKILTIEQWGDIAWSDMSGAFYGCSSLTYNATVAPDLSAVTALSLMFRGCTSFDGNIENWDVSNVTVFTGMFEGATSFNQPLNLWSLSNAVNISGMFNAATAFNQPLNNWNTSNVNNMSGAFWGASAFNQNISSWNVGKVNNMNQMFREATSYNQPITWTTIGAAAVNISMQNMFNGATAFNQSLATWNISQVANMTAMLDNCGMSPANYDATLIGWAGQTVQPSVTLGANGLMYCAGASARATLDNAPNNWTITGDVLDCATSAFVTTWVTTDGQITIPTNGGGYNYNITWTNLTNAGVGDGTAIGQTGNFTISGLQNGSTYRVEISDTFPNIYFNNGNEGQDITKIRTIEQWGSIAWGSMARAFYGCTNLTYNATDVPNLAGVADMNNMLAGATAFNGNATMNTWNTTNITNMKLMFQLTAFNQPLNNWNVSNVTDMRGMFFGSAFNQSINNWNVANVTDMGFMFYQTPFNQPLDNWNVSSVTVMDAMFASSPFNQPLANWERTTPTVSTLANVTNMTSLFELATSFNQPLNTWNVGSVTTMQQMFFNASAFNQNIATWNTASVTNMISMFASAISFNQNIGGWNTGVVTDMSFMFQNATAFNQSLAAWNVGNVTAMVNMLNGCGMNTVNYDATLIGWAGQTVQAGVTLGANGRTYCNAVSARNTLTSAPNNWIISGDAIESPACLPTQPVGSRGMYFDGVDDQVKSSAINLNDFTIEFWLKTKQTGGATDFWQNGFGLVDAEDNGAPNDYGVSLGNGKIVAGIGDGNPTPEDFSFASTKSVNDGAWHHVAVTRAGNAMQIYIDGVLDASGSAVSVLVPVGNVPLTFGSIQTNVGYFNGQLDEIRIFNSVRNAGQIQADMSSTTPNGALGYWNFEDDVTAGNQTIAANTGSLGASANGTLINNPLWTIRVKNTNDSGAESLRQAIIDANTDTDTDYIDFSIQQTNPATVSTIALTSILPDVSQPVLLDGNSAFGSSPNTNAFSAGNNAQIRIEINAAGIGSGANPPNHAALTLNSASNAVIKGLSIYGVPNNTGSQFGIRLSGMTTNSSVEGCYIGLRADGSTPAANMNGIEMGGTVGSNILGWSGTVNPAAFNIISNSAFIGVVTASNNNIIQGNYIGTDITGTAARPNTQRGMALGNAGTGNQVLNNLISGNGSLGGVYIQWGANNTVVKGNWIGTRAGGTGILPNSGAGVIVTGNVLNAVNNCTVGGTVAGEVNIIANNTGFGVVIENGAFGSTANRISGNQTFANTDGGISLTGGANANKPTPVITSATPTLISGTCESGDIVEVFNDTPATGTTNQGRTYLGTATTIGTDWTFAGAFALGDRITATATSAANNTSPFSVADTIAVPCFAPNTPATLLTFGTITSNSIGITSWTPPSAGDAIGYVIAINTNNVFDGPADGDNPTANPAYDPMNGEQVIYNGMNISAFTVTGLSPVTTYHFKVYAYNCANRLYNATGAVFSITTTAIPTTIAAPTELNVQVVSETQIDLTWKDNATNETNYIIARKEGSAGVFGILATLPKDATNYTDNTVAGGITYFYKVKAVAGAVSSDSIILGAVTGLPTPIDEPSIDVGTIIFPNPAKDKFTLQMNNAYIGELECTLIDTKGKIIQKWTLQKKRPTFEYQLDITANAQGLYFFRMNTANTWAIRKVIKAP